MEDSGYYSHGPQDFQVCSSDSAHSIFNIHFSELPASKYNYFLYGFKDEKDFEEFKQDLRDFQKLKRCTNASSEDAASHAALKDLELICRPNHVCQNRRKGHHHRSVDENSTVRYRHCSRHKSLEADAGASCQCDGQTRRDSFGLKADFERRSGLFGFDKRGALTSNIQDILMEFMNGDEHFQEFERVFDNVNNRRIAKEMDHSRALQGPSGSFPDNDRRSNYGEESTHFTGDIFSDFFDNDETFLEFEKELEKFRASRASSLLGSVSSLGSSRDIFGDFKSYCDRNIRSQSSSMSSVTSCSSEEARPSCGDDSPCHGLPWRSVEDWERILRKMKRNSRLMVGTDNHRDGYSRSSMYGLSNGGSQPERYQKTQSLADLTRCHEPGYGSRDNYRAQSINNLPQVKHVPETTDSHLEPADTGVDDTSSFDSWSDGPHDDTRYSSSSTLCSGDLSCSFSCSCCSGSDLHIDEDTDDEISLDYRHSPRTRSHSLMELGRRPTPLGLHTTSADNLLLCRRQTGSDVIFSDYHRAPPKKSGVLNGSENIPCDLPHRDASPTESCANSNRWSRASSALSNCFSDVDSDQYHTACSDISDHFSTAKSDLSAYLHGSATSLSSLDDDRSPSGEGFHQWTPEGHYHSYHGREGIKRCSDRYRPRSGSACQYTCHQHCVPAVTLNCKSVSDDGVEVKTPSPIEPRPHLETSLSLGNIRPGCARSVTTAHPADTSIVQLHPDCAQPTAPHPAQVVQSDPATHTSTHNLSRSASEGFVTSRHSFPYKPGSLTLPKSLGHLPSIPVGSCQQASLRSNIHGPSYPPSTNLAYPPSTGLREDATVQVTQETCTITGDNSNNNKVEELQESLSDISVCPNADGEPANEKDETDSGYRSGTIPDDKLPRIPSQETLDRQELKRKVAKYNHFVPAASLEVTDKESFQGFVKVTMNLIRPITMELGARPPSIYELLTREHIIEENTQQVAFYMPRDTHKSLHITSDTTTKEVVTTLLKKFHILDHPRKFAMYEQEFSDRNKLVRLRRLTDKDFPLRAILTWDPERIKNYRMVLQENETGEIVWDAFSLPELGNFLKVLDREEKETILELKHKYAYMKQYMERRLGELRNERNRISQTNK
ncbi:uncharacterized protein LOC131951346 [Physella acuta]|uniref:uncharacterized protein LOC131951346 n=1 Tax=Physella acuta TaxID=109671 RepID=UPI0027DC5BA0|nr:uncharacterized protein LOC131951346 [Physella acuta]